MPGELLSVIIPAFDKERSIYNILVRVLAVLNGMLYLFCKFVYITTLSFTYGYAMHAGLTGRAWAVFPFPLTAPAGLMGISVITTVKHKQYRRLVTLTAIPLILAPWVDGCRDAPLPCANRKVEGVVMREAVGGWVQEGVTA